MREGGGCQLLVEFSVPEGEALVFEIGDGEAEHVLRFLMKVPLR